MADSETTTRASARPLYLTAAMSSVLLYASFFPLNLGFLIWIALVPLLFLVRSDARPRHIYRAAFFGGLLFYLSAVQWMRVAHPAMYATWIILSIFCSAFFPLGLYITRRLDRAKVPLPIGAPIVWVAFEYFRTHFPTGYSFLEPLGIQHRIGFGWYFLGYSQHDFLPLIQIADITGAYGVSLLIVLVNTVIFLWVWRLQSSAIVAPGRPWFATAIAIALMTATIVYGYQRLDHAPFEQGPRVAMLQSNLPQAVKMGSDEVVRNHMFGLLKQVAQNSAKEPPDLVVWPETTFTDDWFDVAPGIDPDSAPGLLQRKLFAQTVVATHDPESLKRISKEWQELIRNDSFYMTMNTYRCNYLFGLNGLEWEGDKRVWKYNSAKFMARDGTPGLRYDKMHLVPFGEYVPLRATFPWMKVFTPYTGDYSCKPGEHWTRFPLAAGERTFQFGCIICYEDTDPALARRYVQPTSEGPAVDFLVNISNDGWFNGTEEHEQHFAICRFRAIESRRSIVRAVNMGVSGVIDADGRIVALPGATLSESKKIATVVIANVPIDRRDSLYSRWGDWLPLVCWGLLLVSIAPTYCRRQQRKFPTCATEPLK